MNTIVVSAVAFVRDGAVLTVRKRGTSRFMLVGGKPEPGESAAQCAVRETAEEVGLAISDLRLLGEFVSEAANEPGHTLHSTVFSAVLTGEPVVGGEIAELRWTLLDGEYDDLAPMLEHNVMPALRAGGGSEGPPVV
ncbi:NUDIX hydrolase [Nocardioides campestrisoli]|uniref:NUDIX hydrolase n=1 Tax=Nocardioides campestrisoli TaxID=2736757 RepID=UPI00163DCAC6|nr:NUDIX domain-containing protein [Nocardioides campestrisoli]